MVYSIGEAAQLTQLTAHTLRYYEQERIILPLRDEANRRVYHEEHIKAILFIKKLRETGMPLAQVQQYVEFVQQGNDTHEERLQLLMNHEQLIATQMKQLEETRQMIQRKIALYEQALQMGKGELSE